MRQARVEDAYRRLIDRADSRRFGILSVAVTDKRPLADFDVAMPPGLAVISGLNGVGKTTLLRLLYSALSRRPEPNWLRPELLSVGTCVVRLVDGAVETQVMLGGSDDPVPVLHIDAYDLCLRLRRLALQPNFTDLLEGLEPHEFPPEERELAGFIVGKTYERVEVFEVEEPGESKVWESDEDVTLPVFRVESGGVAYDFGAMGLGELAALLILWRLLQVEASTLVFLEEPETFLSSHASVAIVDVLAEQITEKRLYAVVTTHSADIMSHIPTSCARLLYPSAEGMTLAKPGMTDPAERLRITSPRGEIVIVEDYAAKIFAGELLARIGGQWGAGIEIGLADGAANLAIACRTFPESARITLVGILDADQDVPENTRWPILNLPGEGSPEQGLKDAVLAEPESFSRAVGRSRDEVENALHQANGLDLHDWFHKVADVLGLGLDHLLRAATDRWLSIEGNTGAAEDFVRSVATALTGAQ